MDFHILVNKPDLLNKLCSQGLIYVNECGVFMLENGNLRKPPQKEIDVFLQKYCHEEEILNDEYNEWVIL